MVKVKVKVMEYNILNGAVQWKLSKSMSFFYILIVTKIRYVRTKVTLTATHTETDKAYKLPSPAMLIKFDTLRPPIANIIL